jgi:hypothetical protein
MIRFVLGFLIVFGVVGGLDADTINIGLASLVATLGLLLMLWAVSTLNKENEI